MRMVEVGMPGNDPVGIIPFQQGILQNCDGQDPSLNCTLVGDVPYEYEVGETEVTVEQYVAFLNVADPTGANSLGLYLPTSHPDAWPKYGQIRKLPIAPPGEHYQVGDPAWADKPWGFANFENSARFVNSLFNGLVLSRVESSAAGFDYVTYDVQLSPTTETGMYDLERHVGGGATRDSNTGFVVPSQNEWIKAAYYDPAGGGQFSYWQYPTGPVDLGNPACVADWNNCAPNAALLDNTTGDVNAGAQPRALFSPQGPSGAPAGTYPVWCPPGFTQNQCDTVNPLGIDPATYAMDFQGSLGTTGQAGTTGPWGTLDQAGNAVEWTDTISPPPVAPDVRTWRRLHGGISNAPAFQLWISAVGTQPEVPAVGVGYPWLGLRIGYVAEGQALVNRNFNASLHGRTQVPPADSNAAGETIFKLAEDGSSMSYKLIVANIDDVFAAHIHCGAVGVNGPVGVTLFFTPPPNPGPVNGILAQGTITGPDPANGCGWGDLASVVSAIESGGAYVNVHTLPGFPGGEIRGQIR
jgi:hypothetical protein